jgi:hypothetical protein
MMYSILDGDRFVKRRNEVSLSLSPNWPLGWFLRRDYHTVPTPPGRNKDLAEHFRKTWSTHVGPADLVYTRTPEGRRFRLKARTHSMSRSLQTRAEHLKSWQ